MPLEAPESGVRVRMYRHGLGDCFLLTFRGADAEPRYFLIDCGILLNSPGEKERMKTVLQHVREETGGRVHVLIVTHEHWDHVCGFLHQKELFENELEVGEIWMAWTEDPSDPLARELERKHEQAFRAVESALTRLRGLASDGARAEAESIAAVTAFFGGPSRARGLGFSRRTDEAMDLIRGKAPVKYRQPGETFEHPEIRGVRFYVLGPPRSADLFRSDPRKGEAYEESPELALNRSHSLELAFRMGLDTDPAHWQPLDSELWDLSRPFDPSHELSLQEAQGDPWFREHYYGSEGSDHAWRRIDEDWLGGAAELALQLDSDTNNSSLVLAIELLGDGVSGNRSAEAEPGPGKVLLFPGDAQAGSWRSWASLSFEVSGHAEPVTTQELLGRTAFYKVGHHGSHNATLRALGLESMSDDLIAMIPVDRAVAMKPKGGGKGWNMPFPPLEERLRQKARGRVIRADEEVPEEPPREARPEEWAAFREALRYPNERFRTERESQERPIYVELTVRP